jgi:hypothetical protein
MIQCPCKQEMKVTKHQNRPLREEVLVLSCLCGREKEVVTKNDIRFVKSGHDKFILAAGAL